MLVTGKSRHNYYKDTNYLHAEMVNYYKDAHYLHAEIVMIPVVSQEQVIGSELNTKKVICYNILLQ